MPDLSNRELDDLFREGAEMQEFGYNEAAWNDVAGRLDKQDNRRKVLIIFLGTVLALAIALGVWSLFANNESSTAESQVLIASESNNNTNTSALTDKEKNDEVDQTSNNALVSEEALEIIASTTNSTLVYPTKEVIIDKITSQKPVNELAKQGTSMSIGDIEKIGKKTSETNASSINIGNSTIVSKAATVVETVWNEEREVQEDRNIVGIELLNNLDANMLENQLKIATLSLPLDPIKRPNTYGLVLAVSGSAEWSAVDMEPFGKTGYKLGIKAGYQFGKRFEISAGLAYAKKMFKTSGSTFQSDESIWTENVVPETMYGEDNVLEIPVEVSYYHRGYNNSGIFANVGLRSYMMNQETFNFEYSASQTKPGLIQDYTMIEEHEHWLGVLRLSAGYQYRLTGHQAIQVAPYIQIPITGIGHGNQRLYSAGIQLTSRFNVR